MSATIVFSVLPVILLEMIFSFIDSSSIDSLCEADSYIENLIDSLLAIPNLKNKLWEQEEKEFREELICTLERKIEYHTWATQEETVFEK